MSFFDNIFGKLFSPQKAVEVHEMLNRSQQFKEDCSEWTEGADFKQLRKDLLDSWESKRNDDPAILDLETYISDYANGFILYPPKEGRAIPLSFLMEYLKDRMITASYRLVHRDRRIKEGPEHIETIEKYQLKPEVPVQIPMDQLYGNVIIELQKHDNKEVRLKFLASIYADRKYNEALDIHELIHYLFDY